MRFEINDLGTSRLSRGAQSAIRPGQWTLGDADGLRSSRSLACGRHSAQVASGEWRVASGSVVCPSVYESQARGLVRGGSGGGGQGRSGTPRPLLAGLDSESRLTRRGASITKMRR
ncbi:unnamed protein product, partial [Iphiclides podalirius]